MKALTGFDNSERMRAASEAACEKLLALPFEELVRLAKAESSSDLAKFCAAGMEADVFGLGFGAKDVSETRLVSGVALGACRVSTRYITWSRVQSYDAWSTVDTLANDDSFNSADYGMAAA